MKILIHDDRGVRSLEEGYASEEELQTFLKDYAELMPMDEIELGTAPLLCVGWEVAVASGFEDILYVDENGLLTVVETKLHRSPEARREVVGQLLEYAAQMSTWSSAQIESQSNQFFLSDQCPSEYKGQTFEQALQTFLVKTFSPKQERFDYDEFLNAIASNLERGRIRLIIAVDEPPTALRRTVEFINRFSQHFEMYLIQMKRFHDLATGQNIFVPALFGQVTTGRVARQREEWDWGKYRAQLGWTETEVGRGQILLGRLEKIAQPWAPQTRFYRGWISIWCLKHVLTGVSKNSGHLELFFHLPQLPEGISLPEGVEPRQTKEWLYLYGNLEEIGETQLLALLKAAFRYLGYASEHDS